MSGYETSNRLSGMDYGQWPKDNGCSVAQKCTACPLPVCRYEMPGGLPSALNLYRNEEIKKLWRAGIPAEDIAETFGISKRTVYYITDGVARERMIVVEMERQVDIDELTMRVVNEHGVSLGEMQSKSRVQKIVNARHHLMYLLRTEGDWSLKRIGFAIGGRDHSTCIHGIRAHQKRTE